MSLPALGRRVAATALLLALASTGRAAEAPERRPGLVLVLSGGGARGAAHIGVLRVLDELHVKPDLVLGTSMGSIVGGFYAAGWRPDEIEAILRDVDWTAMFVDKPLRTDRPYRRKQDDVDFLIQAKLRFRGFKPYFPPSIVGGQRLDVLLRELERRSIPATDFDELAIPFRAVATDIERGEPVVLDSGSLADAMRASMAVPGVFNPMELGGRKLVDGGVVANLPVGIAIELGAERILAIDISSPLDGEEESLESFLGILGQTNSLLTVLNRREDVARLRPGDVLIVPELGDLRFSDFERTVEAAQLGEAAARAAVDRLRTLAVDDATWAGFEARRATRPVGPPHVDAVRLDNASWVRDGIVAARIDQVPGAALDERALREDVTELAGLEYFGPIRAELAPAPDGRNDLLVRTPGKPYGRSSLQLGLSLRNDFDTDAVYSFALRHLMLALNRRGGEWVNVLQTGNTGVLSSEFYQPLDDRLRWFVSPAVEFRDEDRFLWSDGRPVWEVELRRLAARADGGRVLGSWGELRAGAYFSDVEVRTIVGLPVLPPIEGRDAGLHVAFRVDTLDSIQFPRHGARIELEHHRALEDLGSDFPYRRFELETGAAWSFGRTVISPWFDVGVNLDDEVSVVNFFGLGGFLRLSGLGRDELLGGDFGVARIQAYRELAKIDLGALSQRVYAGLSVEAGNAWVAEDPVTWSSLRYGGSVFLGAETVLGPVYLAWGWTEPDRGRFYFILGERF